VVPATRLQLSSTYRAGAQFPFGQVFEARILRRLNLGRLNALLEQTAEIITGVQALSHELHPPRLLHLGVVAAMQGFCVSSRGRKTSRLISATRTLRGVYRPTCRSVSSGSSRKPCTTRCDTAASGISMSIFAEPGTPSI
jgi:hypothetical protein